MIQRLNNPCEVSMMSTFFSTICHKPNLKSKAIWKHENSDQCGCTGNWKHRVVCQRANNGMAGDVYMIRWPDPVNLKLVTFKITSMWSFGFH